MNNVLNQKKLFVDWKFEFDKTPTTKNTILFSFHCELCLLQSTAVDIIVRKK